ncbi:MAG: sigma-70 family RNA polymerase sigma factor [Opitutales bacterium]|nr:sigma-70 family RNA polymerase sigma factor [Opitutales bacterium]
MNEDKGQSVARLIVAKTRRSPGRRKSLSPRSPRGFNYADMGNEHLDELFPPDLLERVQRGEKRAKDTFARSLQKWTVVFLRIKKSNGAFLPIEEGDAVTLIWLKVFQGIADFDASRPFRPWLWRLAENRLLDEINAHNRRSRRFVSIDAPIRNEKNADLETTLVDLIADGQEIDRARAKEVYAVVIAFLKSHPNQRAVAMLRLWAEEDYSYDEIAERFNITSSGVGVNLHRIRKQLLKWAKEKKLL